MSFWRVLLCVICPPLSVIGKGCGSILIVFILWCLGWIPGVLAALIILNNPER
ncbi:YqaE/Pmp3 family membrane protein [Olleya aquimaris]|uniref:YqaE/Pmp3 family membrane protein n=1 Tax=Olleya sediminilitoris TaxID=2795739 RepID=A0ABS1WQ32_9FLAO|nr:MULTISPECIES: YqaE/Pmp3 family membrane protein [Olleya]AXO80234.1 YqaE/Pmp3 family membrane protein [Olleya aquimaris]MBL7561188.1 YqaE/Pmp3 family membrane protein [Olleya sediminilitoris]